MRFGELWLTACLVTATCGQLLTVQHFITNYSEATNNYSTDSPVDGGTSNIEHKTFYPSTGNSSASHLDITSAAQANDATNLATAPHDQTNESSKTRELGPGKTTSAENPPYPSKESIESENTSDTQSSERVDSIPVSIEKSDSQDSVLDVRSYVLDEESNARISRKESPVGVSGEESNANWTPDLFGDEIPPDDDKVLRQTTHGPVKGHKWKDTDIYAFIDIPYGKVETPFEVNITFYTINEQG